MDTLIRDVRYGIRGLLKRPGFVAVVVLTLALGIGANTAIFSVVNTVVLNPLPFPKPDQLVVLGEGQRGDAQPERGSFSMPDYKDLQTQTQLLSYVATFLSSGTTLSGDGANAERVFGADVSLDYFSVLGARPVLGRFFTDRDRSDSGVVVISESLWQRRYGRNANVIGQTMRMGESSATIIGVMQRGFEYPIRADRHQDFWKPLSDMPIPGSDDRANRSFRVIARMNSGVTIQQTQAELDTISRRLELQYPASNTKVVVGAALMHEDMIADVRPALFILLGAVGFVLLIAGANVANLLLVRATRRQKEIAIRTALGANRWQIVRQLLVESLLLALAGGGLGLLLAAWGVKLLVALSPVNIPRAQDASLDWHVLGFTVLVSALTGVLFGLVPALNASKSDITGAVQQGSRGMTENAQHNRLRSLLVVAEVALSLMLVIGAGLLIRSFIHLLHTDPGFDPRNIVALDVPLSRQRYKTPEIQAAFFTQLINHARNLPGVEAVGLVNNLPLDNSIDVLTFNIAGRPPFLPGAEAEAHDTVVSPEYFAALKIPLRQGRWFTAQDGKDKAPVILISEALARKYFPGENPIGQRLIVEASSTAREIVGVVGDARRLALETAAEPEFYVPYEQEPERRMNLVVRTMSGDQAALVTSLRSLVTTIDKDQTIWQVRTLDELVSRSISTRRFNMLLLGLFAGVAFVLAILGIYGVTAYSVSQRTHEIGIRMALGAQVADVLKLILLKGMSLAFLGVLLGLAGAFSLTRLMRTLLYGVAPTDVMTFATVSTGLIVIALLASYIPARRATKVDPLAALRYE